MSISTAALRRPVTTVAATLALVLLGAVSLGRLPVSLLPDVTLPVLTIRTLYPGSAASEASRFVAEPVEEAIAATPGLVELRSVSRNGEVTTTARFAWGTDMAGTVLTVRERLDNARARLPETADRPTLLTSDPGQRPIAVLGVSGPHDLLATARLAEQVLARRLEQLDGVASVAVSGAPEEEIRVELDPGKLRGLGLTPSDVVTAVQNANASAPGGTIRRGQFRFSVRALTELRGIEEFAAIPVGQPGGPTVRLADIGRVSLTIAEPRTLTRLDGSAGIGLVVYKDAGANTVAVTRQMEQAVTQLGAEFPELHIQVIAAQARFVNDALANLTQEIILGGVLCLLLILLFLGDWRSALAIGLIVPLSVLVSLTALQLLGVTINVFSLGGLALGVGLLVDQAIVVSEASGRLREQGVGRFEAAGRAADEVAGPLLAGTLTTVLVFGPIVFVRGLSAALFRDLSLAVVTSLSASLVLALTLMPVMLGGTAGRLGDSTRRLGDSATRRLGDSSEPLGVGAGHRGGRLATLGYRIAEWYERGMMWSLDHPRTVFGAAAVATVLAGWLALQLPREILPQVDEGMAIATLHLPEGTAIEETARQTARLESAARTLGARGIYARIGAATDEELVAGAEAGGSAFAQVLLPVPGRMKAAQFAAALRTRVPDLSAGALAIDLAGQSEFGSLIGREGRLLRVEASAAEPAVAAVWSADVMERLRAIPGLTDVRDAYAGTQPVIEISLVRDRIARHGLTIDEVVGTLAGGLGGVEASELREADRRTPIRVRYAGAANEDLATALAATVRGVPVGELVSVREVRDPVEVVRINQRPVQVIEASVERGGTARAVARVESVLNAEAAPAGLTWTIAGADVEQRRTLGEMSVVALLSIALVFLVLAGEFASFTTPLIVMLTVPLAAVGGIVVLWLTGQSLNAVSLIGMVVMIGLADNDAVVKLDAIRRFRDQGYSVREAVLLGGRQRLRAIAMTSLTTIVGVLPLVLGWGSGGELYQPLAAGVIGGSVTATLVTFFLLPTAYAEVEAWRANRRVAESPSRRAAELPSRRAAE